jgi:eukaryotic-like serine/threonine-protein kinase
MRWLSDDAVARLRDAGSEPELSGTPYRLLDRLGCGGMGTVYLVEDSRLDRRVAMKVLDTPDRAGDLEARLVREARVLAQLEHPGIVPVHDVGTLADGRIFYTMKFVQGRRLDEIVREPASLPERLRLFQKICEPVAFAHSRGVLHRDLKPENIMVGPFGEVLVMDWGIAKLLAGFAESTPADSGGTENTTATVNSRAKSPPETAHGAVVGTPGYMAPEQACGEIAQLDQRADIFSLGAILRFFVTGPNPSEGATTSKNALRRLSAIAAKAMAPSPEARYASAQDLAGDVAAYLDGFPVSAYPESLLDRAARVISRNRVAIVLVLAYLLARVLLIFWHPR